MNILEKLVTATQKRMEKDLGLIGFEEMIIKAQANISRPFIFEENLKKEGIHFICEVKKASPSKGVLSVDFPYLDIAKAYENAGASCISVLTETDYFLGSDAYLTAIKNKVSTPLLRKDFTIHAYQIYQARAIGADAILLICALLNTAQIREFIALSDSLGLSSVVEAHTEEELESAIHAGARIIGVNNRNLKDFSIDLQNSISLRQKVNDKETIFIAESGIHSHQDVQKLSAHNINVFLVGESLMRSNDKKQMLDSLRGIN